MAARAMSRGMGFIRTGSVRRGDWRAATPDVNETPVRFSVGAQFGRMPKPVILSGAQALRSAVEGSLTVFRGKLLSLGKKPKICTDF